MYVE
jgi:hypothetical protein